MRTDMPAHKPPDHHGQALIIVGSLIGEQKSEMQQINGAG